MFDDSFIPTPSPRLASRTVAGRALILNPELDRLLRLNEVATFIWEAIVRKKLCISSLLQEVLENFEVEPEEAQRDLYEFIESLIANNLIIPPQKISAEEKTCEA